MTDVINPKRASPDQLLPYHKKISAEGKAQMICFISYTYMVLKEHPKIPNNTENILFINKESIKQNKPIMKYTGQIRSEK